MVDPDRRFRGRPIAAIHALRQLCRSGFLDHPEAEKGIRLLVKEVLPRLPAETETAEEAPARAAE